MVVTILIVVVVITVIAILLLRPSQTTQELEDPDLFIDFASTGSELDGAIQTFSAFVENPSTGDKQSVRLYEPAQKGTYPLVVLIPGGTGSGESFERTNLGLSGEEPPDAFTLALEGFVVAVYDPLGTGSSQGDINYQGYDDQDGLAAIIRATQALSEVDEENTGLASFSYGVTGAAGVLARYPELGITFWSDWEGPSSRYFTTVGCAQGARSRPGAISPANFSCGDDAHWGEREAAAFMKTLSVDYYWRIQEVKDHVQSTYGHTIEMLNAAAANEEIDWFRVNDAQVNTTYTADSLPTALSLPHFSAFVLPHIIELSQR